MELTDIQGIGHRKKELLNKVGIHSIGNLITYFPKYYEDLSLISPLNTALFNEKRILIKVEVLSIQRVPTKNKISLSQIKIKDENSTAYLNIFGSQPYYQNLLKIGEQYLISGIFSYSNGKIVSSQFSVEKLLKDDDGNADESLHYGRIVPLYGLTHGLSQKVLRETIYQALLHMNHLQENIPSYIVEKYGFIERKQALQEIHFPSSFENLKKAQQRLKYYELFKLQFQFALKKHFSNQKKPQQYKSLAEIKEKLIKSLPFKLTLDQEKAINEIEADLHSEIRMHRLLLGDVGSGKTLVAVLSALKAIESGYQVVLLAPTEVLAKQHHYTIDKLLSQYFIKVSLLTGSTKLKDKTQITQQLKDGECSFLVGTHSVFTDSLIYHNLSLIIIDEQHKFGVEQRAKLVAKSLNPDLLVMSATPIPRTLTYSLFGDMEVSILKEKPIGRMPITTSWVDKEDLFECYSMAKREIQNAHQCYIVYPIVEESEVIDTKSLIKSYEKLRKGFFSFTSVALLHGKMSESEKIHAIEEFKKGKVSVLIATTVIEVGVDIPNATIIIIEDAHRFGLSTLHQLRGRVGRSDLSSLCILATPPRNKLSEDAIERMNIMVAHDDGFLIAQKDLELRGSGNILGYEQKGNSGLKITSLITDSDILEKARKDAFQILKEDPNCINEKYKVLKPLINQFHQEYLSILHN